MRAAPFTLPSRRLTCVAALLLACSSAAAAQTSNAFIRVEVRSEGDAVAGASVLANGITTIADRAGVAALVVAPGRLDLTVTRDGYLPSTLTLIVAAGEQRTVPVDLQKLQEESALLCCHFPFSFSTQPIFPNHLM